jgi:hypothetical protein
MADGAASLAQGDSRLWSIVHGTSLLLGTVVVLVGFAAGLMYLIQARRLKHKLPPSDRFPLPSLEWLQRVNARALALSMVFLTVGVVSGLVLNQAIHHRSGSAVAWSDPIVWSSCLLFAWLAVVAVFGAVYKPARSGQKVAYLTVGSFVFVVLVLAVLVLTPSSHAL